ncbi:hypothetical protein BH23CHL4_BH23CHL4_16590 [soil metagenome]
MQWSSSRVHDLSQAMPPGSAGQHRVGMRHGDSYRSLQVSAFTQSLTKNGTAATCFRHEQYASRRTRLPPASV